MHDSGDQILRRVERSYHERFETSPLRASVSFVGVNPIEVLLYRDSSDPTVQVSNYLTLGMSSSPMTEPGEAVVNESGPRAELELTLLGAPDEAWRQLAILAAGPAVESAVYRVNDRIDLGAAWLPGSRCSGAVLVASDLVAVPVGTGQVEILRVVPATDTELAWARVHGTQRLLELWQAVGTELRDLYRAPVPLG
ncbi:MAG TPA: suppressor of fused domain protein [Jatrophihabitans sp.]|nr:suppressor of fused domain protein [Jatrophihabitans sp.]